MLLRHHVIADTTEGGFSGVLSIKIRMKLNKDVFCIQVALSCIDTREKEPINNSLRISSLEQFMMDIYMMMALQVASQVMSLQLIRTGKDTYTV